jgi:hypothetical protein
MHVWNGSWGPYRARLPEDRTRRETYPTGGGASCSSRDVARGFVKPFLTGQQQVVQKKTRLFEPMPAYRRYVGRLPEDRTRRETYPPGGGASCSSRDVARGFVKPFLTGQQQVVRNKTLLFEPTPAYRSYVAEFAKPAPGNALVPLQPERAAFMFEGVPAGYGRSTPAWNYRMLGGTNLPKGLHYFNISNDEATAPMVVEFLQAAQRKGSGNQGIMFPNLVFNRRRPGNHSKPKTRVIPKPANMKVHTPTLTHARTHLLRIRSHILTRPHNSAGPSVEEGAWTPNKLKAAEDPTGGSTGGTTSSSTTILSSR